MSEENIMDIITNSIQKYALENEIFAIRDNRPPKVDNCIYVNGYISLDAIIKNIKNKGDE